MILFDPDQPESAEGFPQFSKSDGTRRAALPTVPTLRRSLRQAQEAAGVRGEVTVLLTTDDGIRRLNRLFRKKNKATDVLSFPSVNMMDAPDFEPGGDLAISVETAARQAAEQGHALAVELRVLMLHGLLHLSGMDHETDRGEMAALELKLREKFGLPAGLIERVEGQPEKQIPFGNDSKKGKSKAKGVTAGSAR